MKNEIIAILMDVNEVSKEDALQMYQDIQDEINDCDLQDYDEVFEILGNYGLEFDYLPEFVM